VWMIGQTRVETGISLPAKRVQHDTNKVTHGT